MSDYRLLGKLNISVLEAEFGRLRTDDIIITDERLEHIRIRHPEDFELFALYGRSVVSDPDCILRDGKCEGTVFMIKHISGSNLNVVVRVALQTDPADRINSVMTFYRIRDKNLKKLKTKSKTLYNRE